MRGRKGRGMGVVKNPKSVFFVFPLFLFWLLNNLISFVLGVVIRVLIEP